MAKNCSQHTALIELDADSHRHCSRLDGRDNADLFLCSSLPAQKQREAIRRF